MLKPVDFTEPKESQTFCLACQGILLFVRSILIFPVLFIRDCIAAVTAMILYKMSAFALKQPLQIYEKVTYEIRSHKFILAKQADEQRPPLAVPSIQLGQLQDQRGCYEKPPKKNNVSVGDLDAAACGPKVCCSACHRV